ncbi:hypothetical protein [Mycoplasma phocimorsus]|nr:hypothetical protein [Mycoplasma phocimorsus]MDJ1648966.1 hypothetical protein [Mycoplasma phocimorsus]
MKRFGCVSLISFAHPKNLLPGFFGAKSVGLLIIPKSAFLVQ